MLLHGVTGNSNDQYMIEVAGAASRAGYNVIIACHYAPRGEKNLRLNNFTKKETIDEMFDFAKKRFGVDKRVENYLIGFSLGGCYALTYAGLAAK